MVCINGGEWYQVHQTEKSPELKLRKGINIIFLSGTSPDQAKKVRDRDVNGTSYIYILYWDGDEDNKKFRCITKKNRMLSGCLQYGRRKGIIR